MKLLSCGLRDRTHRQRKPCSGAFWEGAGGDEQHPQHRLPATATLSVSAPDVQMLLPDVKSSLMHEEVKCGPAQPLHHSYLRPSPAAHEPSRVTQTCFGAGQNVHERNCIPAHSRSMAATTWEASNYRNVLFTVLEAE